MSFSQSQKEGMLEIKTKKLDKEEEGLKIKTVVKGLLLRFHLAGAHGCSFACFLLSLDRRERPCLQQICEAGLLFFQIKYRTTSF